MSHGVEVLTGGTDVHLVLVDLGRPGSTARPPSSGSSRSITVNRNAIPFDERPPMNPSGLRIGTPALTTRGLVEDDLREIAEVIAIALGQLRCRARGTGRADRLPDGAVSALRAAVRRARLGTPPPLDRGRGAANSARDQFRTPAQIARLRNSAVALPAAL